jgi:hypothetical protein
MIIPSSWLLCSNRSAPRFMVTYLLLSRPSFVPAQHMPRDVGGAAAAGLVPARRASLVDPNAVLRHD